MAEKSSKSAKESAMSAVHSANDQVREMLISIGGALNWNDTRESWRARLARKVESTERRVRAIINHERVRLSADEYLKVLRAYEAADSSMARIRVLARDAAVSRDRISATKIRGDEV